MKPSVYPTVNPSGTSRETLFNEYRETVDALRKAQWELSRSPAHPRDYNTRAEFDLAMSEQKLFAAMIENAREYYQSIVEHLDK